VIKGARAVAEVHAPAARAAAPTTSRGSGVFITGTDTGVGKTTVACALLALARSRGLLPLPWKPVETGAAGLPEDALRLRAAAGRDDLALSDVCPFAFASPVAPAKAAAEAGIAVGPEALLAAARLMPPGDFLLVESAGGLLSPYAPGFTSADLAALLALPVLLVSRNALGTINHTALALAEIRRRGLPLAGVVLVDTTPEPTPDRQGNADLIFSLTGVRPLGPLPFVPSDEHTPPSLARALAAALDVEDLFRRLVPARK
jgi:dethiobiotin synthetase